MYTSKKIQHGFSMIEVLVSLIVIGVGMLGLSGLQIASIKGTNNAHSRNVASMLIMELSDRMRANPAGVTGGFYENNVNCTQDENQCRTATFCSAENVARLDVQEIKCGVLKNSKREGGVANLLPAAVLTIDHGVNCDAGIIDADETTITITWNNANVHKDQAASAQNQTMTICTIP